MSVKLINWIEKDGGYWLPFDEVPQTPVLYVLDEASVSVWPFEAGVDENLQLKWN